MCRFVESIKLCDGEFYRLPFHQNRMNQALSDFYHDVSLPSLSNLLFSSEYPKKGLYKCRIVFDNEIRDLQFEPYKRREIHSLKIVETDMSCSNYKKENRDELNLAFAKRGSCDDVLLIKNGYITDTSYCNVALFDGEKWITPKKPLIPGVNRASLIEEKKIAEEDIKVSELLNFRIIRLFNAMIEFGEIEIDISGIFK